VLGINDLGFCLFTDVLGEILFQAFVCMPTLVVQAKIIPANIEGTMFALFMSMSNLSNGFVAPFVGACLSTAYGVTDEDFTRLPTLVTIQFLCSFLPLLMIPMLPNNKQLSNF
jgi:hypothetical protein